MSKKRSGVESMSGGTGSHHAGVGPGAGAQSGAGSSKKAKPGARKSASKPQGRKAA
jgi:hypothetical protein